MTKNKNDQKIVFVEGRDDKHVVSRIISKSDLAELDICVIEKEGINNLLDALSADAKRPECSAVGFVLNANYRPEGRWNSVVNRFMNEGINFPNSICLDGTIVKGSSEKDCLVSVFGSCPIMILNKMENLKILW